MIDASIHTYIYFTLGIIAQLFCIFIPITFKDWDLDVINCLTYCAVQGFICLFLFLLIPIVLTGESSFTNTLILYLLGGTIILSFARVALMIPLEGSVLEVTKVAAPYVVDFSNVMTPQKQKLLSTINPKDPKAAHKYTDIREKLYRSSPDAEEHVDALMS